VLANSTRAIKVFIAITDGWWSDSTECDELIRELRSGGVITALGFIGSYSADNILRIDSHGCEVAANVTKMPELFQLSKRMVNAGIQRNLAR
jgi:hypothetical protein